MNRVYYTIFIHTHAKTGFYEKNPYLQNVANHSLIRPMLLNSSP